MLTTNILPALLATLLCSFGQVNSHEDHGRQEGETLQQYAARHMATEHHIDSFDAASFFHLHDLNRDGFWDSEEIEAIYGVHHTYSQEQSKDDDDHSRKALTIVNTILSQLDADKDGKVSLAEFESKGLESLPNFNHLGAEGHHYDLESEFFLHHEEKYHASPETQTDDSYHHPEDLEHFDKHESIELEEQRRERKYTELTEEQMAELLKVAASNSQKPEASEKSLDNATAQIPLEGSDPAGQHVLQQQGVPVGKPRYTREVAPEDQDPEEKFADALKNKDDQSDWGKGKDGYKRPKTASEKLRRNLPYKYKFRRNWGDF